jgi:GDP/UDP-N,N'-diacetylbacillosamine 2-epimerase (hydrolysing)
MKIGVLTSSRADYGIYLPLLNKLKNDDFFEIELIVFGTHLSKEHNYTILDIRKDNYNKIHEIDSLIKDDSKKGIVISYGNTVSKFAKFWENNIYDLVFSLGDRFEMSAAVQSSIPFGIKIAHIHGGETTLGAIDNIYRHQITLASDIHFVTTTQNLLKVKSLKGNVENIYDVGSLSLNNIDKFQPTDKLIFLDEYKIPSSPFALVTFHPETVSADDNLLYVKEMKKTLTSLSEKINIIITMPNADTLGSLYRNELKDLKIKNPSTIFLIENFGKINYFNAMYYAKILIGNTSSGIIEAASFNKYVVNVGDRQKGRSSGGNVYNVRFQSKDIISLTHNLLDKNDFSGSNIYFKKNPADNIIEILKKI